MYKRPTYQVLLKRLEEPRRFMQVLAGPRQVGKTTLVQQVQEDLQIPCQYASADEPVTKDRVWVEQQWDAARRFVSGPGHAKAAVLVLDEIQKVPGWSEIVKFLWDQDSANRLPLRVVLLGSAPLLVQRGLSESLAGRFEVIPITHWALAEMKEAFDWSLEQYVYHGGYPGAAPLVEDARRWRQYVLHSLVETTISKDILEMRRVDNPALLRRLFELGCQYSGQILSLTKMLGQLQDRGNTSTLAHYLDMLRGCGLLEGLQKYAGQKARQRASSPKLQVHNNALLTALENVAFKDAMQDPEYWGRLVESSVGSHLVNQARVSDLDLFYWRDVNQEVDFVLVKGGNIIAIEVKSTRRRTSLPGIEAFARQFKVHKKLLVGGQGIPLEEFLTTDANAWF
jgi:predicted AAA+ superfamily ATPase